MEERTLAIDAAKMVGQEIMVEGWVHSRRDHGGLIFIDLRDHSGVLQLVLNPEHEEAFRLGESLRDEYVIKATGVINERSEDLINPKIATGKVELLVGEISVLNKSEALPIQIFSEAQANEELRYKYRYLDLRRPQAQNFLRRRAQYNRVIREYMEKQEFIEITTPILANSSPEGARDFLVPSRIHPGKFYALPQAPQQFKQLLMVGGIPRYYQIATCFRDEDPRADRLYGDFYQLDLEIAFVENGEIIRSTMEPLIKQLVTDFAGKQLAFEDIPRIPYKEALDKYGTDKPDLRYGLELNDLSEEMKNSQFGVFSGAINNGGVVKAVCANGAGGFTRSQIDDLTKLAQDEGAKGLAYIVFQHNDIKSPIAKFLSEEELGSIKSKLKVGTNDIVFFAADSHEKAVKVLGKIRDRLADMLNLKDDNKVALAWIVDFPFYEWDDKNNRLDFGHNPFSMPIGGLEALDSEDKLSIHADQYDMAMNGYEICSGAVRNHNPEIMYKAFANLGYDKEFVERKFGAMLSAFKYGAPPHAGCAFGLDRIFMVLTDEPNIREVVAFPKNGSGVDPMTDSPTVVDDIQLKDLNIRLTEKS